MMKKPLLAAMGLIFANAAFANNDAQTTQDGSNNTATTDQTGSNNTAYVYQQGSGNQADVDQTGNGTEARINAISNGAGGIQQDNNFSIIGDSTAINYTPSQFYGFSSITNGSVQIIQDNGSAAGAGDKTAVVNQSFVTGTGGDGSIGNPYDVRIEQTGAGGDHQANVSQANTTFTTASVTQSGASPHRAFAQQINITEGGRNAAGYGASIAQSGDGLLGNDAIVTQLGTDRATNSVEQDGDNNDAVSFQHRAHDAAASVTTLGDGNNAYIFQTDSFFSEASIFQGADDQGGRQANSFGSTATITQTATNSDARVIQLLNDHTADILQDGSSNFARVSQYGGVANDADVDQTGTNNNTYVAQGGDTNLGNNSVTVEQSGARNQILFEQGGLANSGSNALATIEQSGSDSQFTLYQNHGGGSNQTLTVTGTNLNSVDTYALQGGQGHTATITQTNVTGGTGTIAPEFVNEYQFPGSSGDGTFDVSVVQSGNGGHSATLLQDGTTASIIDLIQRGDNMATATIDQINAGSNLEAFVTQGVVSSDGLMTADVNQENTFNRGTIEQNGGDLEATINQSGAGTSGAWNVAEIAQTNFNQMAVITQLGGSGNFASITQQ